MKIIKSAPTLADMILGERKVKETFFSQINALIDWTPVRLILESVYTKGRKPTGRPSFDSIVLFKIELLRTWYGLSDGEIEEQVKDRISFCRFIGLSMEDIVPDSTTICRFRNTLAKNEIYDTLLNEINRQLEEANVVVKRGAIVDASITDSSRRPRGKKVYTVVTDREEDKNKEEAEKAFLKEVTKPNVDKEACWTFKMKQLRFGYKRHTITDVNGLIVSIRTMPSC